MTARLLSIVLCLMLLACPYTCDGGCCANTETPLGAESIADVAYGSRCCHHCTTERHEQPAPQAPHRKPAPASKLNCICAGAIQKSGGDSLQSIESLQTLLCHLIAATSPQAIPAVDSFGRDEHDADGSLLSGRALRTEISSLLC